MSASHAPVLDAVTLQLATALEQYVADMDRLADTWLDMELYGCVSEEIEEIRLLAASSRVLSAPWVELLIVHSELVHGLWREANGTGDGRLGELRARHSEAVASLRRHCLRLLMRNAVLPGPDSS